MINASGDSQVPTNDLVVGTLTTGESYGNNPGDLELMFGPGPSLTHNNFVISNFNDALDSATLKDFVILTPSGGGTPQEQAPEFEFNFKETKNAQAGTDCPAAGNGIVFPDDLCGDILVLGNEVFQIPVPVNHRIEQRSHTR